jgi:hypothetical protein
MFFVVLNREGLTAIDVSTPTAHIRGSHVIAKSNRNSGKPWTPQEVRALKLLVHENTPAGVISLKMGRTKPAIYYKASQENISLKPINQPPYNWRKIQSGQELDTTSDTQ